MDISKIKDKLISKSINEHYTKRYVNFIYGCIQNTMMTYHQPSLNQY